MSFSRFDRIFLRYVIDRHDHGCHSYCMVVMPPTSVSAVVPQDIDLYLADQKSHLVYDRLIHLRHLWNKFLPATALINVVQGRLVNARMSCQRFDHANLQTTM